VSKQKSIIAYENIFTLQLDPLQIFSLQPPIFPLAIDFEINITKLTKVDLLIS